jgi:hypothetical protein
LQQLKLLGLESDPEKIKVLNEIKERLLAGLFGLVGGLSCAFSPIFVPVLAGTVIGPIKSVVTESTHPPLHIPLPLLSFEASLNIFSQKNTQFLVPVQNSPQLRQLLSDCGGHCRSLEILYDSFLDAYNEDISLINWKVVIDEVRVVLNQRYSLSTIPLATAIAKSLLRHNVGEMDTYPELGGTTYQDLEETGLIKLENGKVKISYFFVCCFLSKSKITPVSLFWRDLLIERDFWWQDWEVFNRDYIAFRLSLFAYLGKTKVPLKEFFAGAKMNIPVDIDINIPPIEELKISKVSNQYPLSAAAFTIGDSVLNAAGAPFDSFLYLDTTSNARLLLALQMKLANQDSTTQQVISNETVDDEFNKINNALANHIPGTDFVCIILGRCEGSFTESNLPSKCVVVSREEQLSFYGESFYQRLNNRF